MGAMLRRYGEVLRLPGAWRFSAAGVLARLPIGMLGLALVMVVSLEYDSYALAGVVSAVYIVSVAVCAPQLSRLVDRFGQARVMRPAITVAAAASLVVAFAATQQAPGWVLMVFASLAGAGQGSMPSLVRARWTHVTRDSAQLHTAFAMEAALDEIAFMTGPVISTWVATSVASWLPVVISAVAQLVGGWLFLSMRETEPPLADRSRTVRGTGVLSVRVLWLVFVVYLMQGLIFGATDVGTVAFAEMLGVPGQAGPALLVFSFGSFVAGIVYGGRQWPGEIWQHFVLGSLVMAVGASSFFFATSIPMLAAFMFVTGLALSPTFVSGQTLVQRLVPRDRVTEGMAWVSTSLNIGVSVGAAVGGIAIDAYGPHGGFGTTSAGAMLALVMALAAAPVLSRRTTGA